MIKKKIKSPCQNICVYDSDNICIGCYRSLDEVVNWDRYTEEMKMQVLENIARRRKEKGVDDYYGFG
ncbi:MAG: DUF1289 domain-containing protein [Bacteroidales bacterium]|jgi:predicted Fe-S protein YdhL (DUF1289 family)|nr:DUF1289 domain-containing protein [Bacteroidales bacterium]MDY0368900.1 DUF1289 domain-containing protein [Bacteroidales bacterium]